MTGRVVPLRDDEAGDARVGSSAEEPIALVDELSRRAWTLTRHPIPDYNRDTMPVRLTHRIDQR